MFPVAQKQQQGPDESQREGLEAGWLQEGGGSSGPRGSEAQGVCVAMAHGGR